MLRVGDILRKRYRIERHIKKGGMGSVYEAWDNNLDNKVAIKYSSIASYNFSQTIKLKLRRAFKREARLLSKLRHPNLPIAIDYFEQGDSQYLVMDYIEGEDLQQLLKNQGTGFSVEQVVQWADSLLDTLTYLHGQAKPLIHRDIKPANLKVTATGKIMLLDFGLAKGGLPDESGGTIVYGKTPGYSSPEQIAMKTTNECSDLYALSATLYYLLTAKRPADAKRRQHAAKNNFPDPLKPANKLNPLVPAALAKVLASGMALEPSKRPASASQMRFMLKAAVGLPQTRAVRSMSLSKDVKAPLPRPSNAEQKKRRQRSHAKRLAVVAIALLLSLLPILYIVCNRFSMLDSCSPSTPTPSITIIHTPVVTSILTNTPPPPPPPPPPTATEPIPTPIPPTVTRRMSPISVPVTTTTTLTVTEVPPTVPTTEPLPINTSVVPTLTPPPPLPASPTPLPAPTNTPLPAPTNPPAPTSPPPPSPTNMPPPTNTPAPTNTPLPPPTSTPLPTSPPLPSPRSNASSTSTPSPAPTSTPLPSYTPLLLPTSTPLPSYTPPPSPTSTRSPVPAPTETVYEQAPQPRSPFNEEKVQSDHIFFEWDWNGRELQADHQFLIRGLRDGEWLELGRFKGNKSTDVPMRRFGNFETEWQWYIVVIDASGKEVSPRSEIAHFSISLHSGNTPRYSPTAISP